MSSELIPNAPQLWRTLAAYIGCACALFGDPRALAQSLSLTRAQAKHIRAWLRPLEEILRRLLFLDALALAPEPALARVEAKTRAPRTMPAAFGATFDPGNTETWRASFKLHATERRRPRRPTPMHAGEGAGAPNNCVPAAPLALRFEALIRAYNEREDNARRLARQLARDAAPAYVFLSAPKPPPESMPLWTPVREAALLCLRAIAPPAPAPVDSS